MPSTDIKQEFAQNAVPAAASGASVASRPAIIATRKRCEADGVGLSHYVLMDRREKR
ncbi:modified peptide precursor CbpA [Aromatoleum toluvorans]|uniref:Modified peptide CbpA n=1 Tax=Aromatoleum toluvorans TaxID=92002 RepID=A0ABX1Q7U6_9RHOO|nr:modified peptide precursor CbpA [Aromatoleum toluvorans]